jgi:hypothetical protein
MKDKAINEIYIDFAKLAIVFLGNIKMVFVFLYCLFFTCFLQSIDFFVKKKIEVRDILINIFISFGLMFVFFVFVILLKNFGVI